MSLTPARQPKEDPSNITSQAIHFPGGVNWLDHIEPSELSRLLGEQGFELLGGLVAEG